MLIDEKAYCRQRAHPWRQDLQKLFSVRIGLNDVLYNGIISKFAKIKKFTHELPPIDCKINYIY